MPLTALGWWIFDMLAVMWFCLLGADFLWFIYLLVLWVYISHTLSGTAVSSVNFSFLRQTLPLANAHSPNSSITQTIKACAGETILWRVGAFPALFFFLLLLYINKIFNLNINYTISVAETKSTDIFSPPFASAYENCCSAAYPTPRDGAGTSSDWMLGRIGGGSTGAMVAQGELYEHQYQRYSEYTHQRTWDARVLYRKFYTKNCTYN